MDKSSVVKESTVLGRPVSTIRAKIARQFPVIHSPGKTVVDGLTHGGIVVLGWIQIHQDQHWVLYNAHDQEFFLIRRKYHGALDSLAAFRDSDKQIYVV